MINQCANQSPHRGIKRSADFRYLDITLSVIAILLLLPVWLLNTVSAWINNTPVTAKRTKIDALGRQVQLHVFNKGIARNSANQLSVLKGDIAWCGVPMTHMLAPQDQLNMARKYNTRPGLYSISQLHDVIGLAELSLQEQIEAQCQQSLGQYLTLVSKYLFNATFFSSTKKLTNRQRLSIFQLPINNITMQAALTWAVKSRSTGKPELGFFVNANSVNLLYRESKMRNSLNQAHRLFADGSGMRLAAKHAGFALNDNINGTDMLPKLCKACVTNQKSLYLLGAKPGIAAKAAQNLQKAYPGLQIVGSQHGYFDQQNSDDIVAGINQSKADIVLVALGSPHQEQWCVSNSHKLHCSTLLAVGGLFDYFADAIPRAPLWMREVGLEWVWRLIQEPVAKFHRYVIGTPEFLIRTFIFNQAQS